MMNPLLLQSLLKAGPKTAGVLLWPCALLMVAAYLVGSVPFSYIVARAVTGEDITAHGTGNVGAMNVRRTTGSWLWFTIAMLADALKGFLPTFAAVIIAPMLMDRSLIETAAWTSAHGPGPLVGVALFGPQVVVLGTVLGHNYSLWLSLKKRRLTGGKGLATGAGALLAYDYRYFLIVLAVGLVTIAITRYMMAGQIAAIVSLPVFTFATRQEDSLFALVLAALVYARHHRRFLGLLRGEEPRMYVEDRMGPRG